MRRTDEIACTLACNAYFGSSTNVEHEEAARQRGIPSVLRIAGAAKQRSNPYCIKKIDEQWIAGAAKQRSNPYCIKKIDEQWIAEAAKQSVLHLKTERK